MAKSNKTNAARMLDRAGIGYELIPYAVDDLHLDAKHVAEQLGEDIDQVFKTLVLRDDHGSILVCVIPGGRELNLKAVARTAGSKSVALIRVRELLDTVGYVRGGCSPIGMKKKFPTFIDDSCLRFDYIYVSAGIRGMQLRIRPADLMLITQGVSASLCSTFT